MVYAVLTKNGDLIIEPKVVLSDLGTITISGKRKNGSKITRQRRYTMSDLVNFFDYLYIGDEYCSVKFKVTRLVCSHDKVKMGLMLEHPVSNLLMINQDVGTLRAELSQGTLKINNSNEFIGSLDYRNQRISH